MKNFIKNILQRRNRDNKSKVIWTGPSVRVKDFDALMESESMDRDKMAVKQLREKGILK